MKTLSNIHPDEVLPESPGISQNALARAAVVPRKRINDIISVTTLTCTPASTTGSSPHA